MIDMGNDIDSVSKKILDDAFLEREKIINEAKAKANLIIEQAINEKKKILEEGRRKAEERHKEIYNLELLKIKAEFNQKLLLDKLKCIDEVIQKVKEKLSNLDRGSYIRFLQKAIKELEIKDGEYKIGSKEKNIDDELVKVALGDLKVKKSDDKAEFEKGIKIISGKVEYYISPESTIEAGIDDIRMAIAHFLFDEEE